MTGKGTLEAGASGGSGGRTTSTGREVERLLARLAVRLGLRRGLGALAALLPWLLLALALALAAARLGLLVPPPLPAVLAGAALVLLASLAAGLLSAPSPYRTALLVDRELDTGEVVSAGREAGPGCTHPLWRACRLRAASRLGAPDVGRAFPLTTPRAWRPAALAAAALLLVPMIPPPRPDLSPPAPASPAVVQAGEEIEKALENLRGRLDEADRLESTDLMERLEALAGEMERGDLASVEEALAALDRLDTAIAAEGRAAEELGRSTGFEEILKQMADDPFTTGLARAMESGERRALRMALERMAGAMTGEQAGRLVRERMLEGLASRLKEISQMLRMAGEKELAAILREAAEAVRSGDLARARELLRSERLLAALETSCEQAGTARGEMARDLSDLVQHARYLLGMGTPRPLEQARACSHGPGCGCAGPGPGTGSTNRAGRGYRTQDPLIRDRQSDATSDRTGDWEALYDSQILEAESWEDVQASGKVSETGQVLSEVGRSPAAGGEATLPLRPVAAPARGRAEAAADLERVPPGYRDVVRRYFTRFREASPPETEAGDP